MPRSLRALAAVLGLAFRADPWRAVATAAIQIVEAICNVAAGFWLKFIVDAVLAGDMRRAVAGVVGSVVTFWLGGFLNLPRYLWTILVQERTSFLIDRRVMEMSLRLPGLEHHERPRYMDEIHVLRSQRQALAGIVGTIVLTLQLLVLLFGSLALLASADPLLLLLPLFALPAIAFSGREAAINQRALVETAEANRVVGHLFALGTSAGAGKELRLFGLRELVLDRFAQSWRAIERQYRKHGLRAAAVSAASWLVFMLAYAGGISHVVLRAIEGRATAGDVLMALTLAGQVSGFMAGSVSFVFNLVTSLKLVERYLWLVDYARAHMPPPGDHPAPASLETGIDLHHVDFTYPDTDTEVLRDVNLRLPAGSTVALVGENGAGKTTLVKLLLRFYEPTHGAITVDDVPLAQLDADEWRERATAAFQDFVHLELLARESVGAGHLPDIDDTDAVGRALVRAGGEDVRANLPRDLETQLGRSFADGVELSGGQWQKLALGRAMMRETPLLLVLDEPTASLDAQTEHALFERYVDAASRSAGTNGAITVLVSHRFSTVRMADLIVVLDSGTVAEQGTHAELVALGGLYAELYELQARSYR